ncbi:MAG: AtpZ/AtpI family protein [Microthrixaceae bacterium]
MNEPEQRTLAAQMNTSHGSFELVMSPLLLAALGWWLDGRFGTRPWWTIGLGVFGLVGAVTKVLLDYRMKMAEVGRDAAERRLDRQAARDTRLAGAAARRAAETERLAGELAAAEQRSVLTAPADRAGRAAVAEARP